MKYRHTLEGALDLDDSELSVLAVLMLRGPQTPGELKTRTERLHRFGDMAELSATLDRLTERRFARSLGRRPGQREERYRHLLGAEGEQPAAAEAEEPAPADVAAPSGAAPDSRDERVERLEREVAELRAELRALRDRLDA
jgi:uncharacterized protein YceH (UPF0502 family)